VKIASVQKKCPNYAKEIAEVEKLTLSKKSQENCIGFQRKWILLARNCETYKLHAILSKGIAIGNPEEKLSQIQTLFKILRNSLLPPETLDQIQPYFLIKKQI